MARTNRKAAAEAAKAKVAEIHATLTEQVEALTTSEDWTRWLQTAGRFHAYSFGNVLLIGAQRPDATRVAGYRTWQALGRQVRKGETGIRILAPRTGKCHGCAGQGDGCTRCGGSGTVLWFASAAVFDVAQTDGDPLPEIAHRLDGSDPAGLFDTLAGALLPEGWTIDREPLAGEVNGYCQHDRRRIVVDANLAPSMAVKTLAHELAHAAMHGPQVDYHANRGRCEVEAESVAYVVLSALGIDSGSWTFGYVASWADGDTGVVEATGRAVMRTAQRFLEQLEPAEVEVEVAQAA
jgi:antirestriction protein ArdC